MIKNHATLPKYRTETFLVLALPLLYFISRHNYNLFHSFADGVSIVIAACVFTIIWNGRRIVDNDYYLYVGIAFFFFAFWDLMHLLGNKNMGVFPQYGNLGPALYIVSRYILSISLLVAPLFINRRLNTTLMFVVYSLVTLFILLSIFYWNIFPVCIVDGVGLTPFKVVSDYIICLILLGSMGLLLINRRSFDSGVLRLIVFSVILSIATGLAFTLYADPFGIMNAVGHFFQIASFSLVYLAFIETSLTKPQDILYRKLKQSEEKLAENVEKLNGANIELKQEIAERKKTEEALRESELLRRLSIENMLEAYALHEAIFDENGRMVDYRFLEFNPAAQKIASIAREEIVGRTAKELYPNIVERGLLDRYADVMATGVPTIIDDFYYAGDHLNKALDIACFRIDDRHFVCVFRDITDRKQADEALRESENKYRELSIIDDLTKLYNSRYFYTQLSMEIDRVNRYGQPLTLLLLDLDDFKRFNDAYGHIEGDQVLLRLGQVVKRCLRQTDSAYRYGGEEFTILLPMTTSMDGAVTAERIRKELKNETFSPAPGQNVHVTVSIGLAQYKPQEEMKAFVHRVDQLMYQGKKNGKDRVCCESSPQE